MKRTKGKGTSKRRGRAKAPATVVEFEPKRQIRDRDPLWIQIRGRAFEAMDRFDADPSFETTQLLLETLNIALPTMLRRKVDLEFQIAIRAHYTPESAYIGATIAADLEKMADYYRRASNRAAAYEFAARAPAPVYDLAAYRRSRGAA